MKLIELSKYIHAPSTMIDEVETFIVNAAHIIYVRVLGERGSVIRTIDNVEHFVSQKAHDIFAMIQGEIAAKPAQDPMLD